MRNPFVEYHPRVFISGDRQVSVMSDTPTGKFKVNFSVGKVRGAVVVNAFLFVPHSYNYAETIPAVEIPEIVSPDGLHMASLVRTSEYIQLARAVWQSYEEFVGSYPEFLPEHRLPAHWNALSWVGRS